MNRARDAELTFTLWLKIWSCTPITGVLLPMSYSTYSQARFVAELECSESCESWAWLASIPYMFGTYLINLLDTRKHNVLRQAPGLYLPTSWS